MELYYKKYHHANGNAHSQAGDVDNGVVPVSDQISECSFKIVFDHLFQDQN